MIVEKVKNGFVLTIGNSGYEEKLIKTEEEFFESVRTMAQAEISKMSKNTVYIFKISCYQNAIPKEQKV